MLPLYIRQRGGTDGLAGVVMAAFFVAGVVSQYPAGRLADRIGRRPVFLSGLVLYGLASLAFLAPLGPTWEVGLRALQGVGAGAAEVASLAMVAGAVDAGRRARRSPPSTGPRSPGWPSDRWPAASSGST